jgi:hypothetical protein
MIICGRWEKLLSQKKLVGSDSQERNNNRSNIVASQSTAADGSSKRSKSTVKAGSKIFNSFPKVPSNVLYETKIPRSSQYHKMRGQDIAPARVPRLWALGQKSADNVNLKEELSLKAVYRLERADIRGQDEC